MNRSKTRAIGRHQIKKSMRAKRMTQNVLAEKSDVGLCTIRELCHGNPIMPDRAQAVALVLEIPYEKAFKETSTNACLSSRSIRAHHAFISMVLSTAEKEMLVPYNAAKKATPPKQNRRAPDFYQPEQISAIWDALDTELLKWQAIVHLLIVTGCRRGEIMGLRWDKIDLKTGVVIIDTALLYTKSKGVYEDTTKTGRARHIILPPESITLLKKWRALQSENRLVCGDRWVNSGYVFTQDTGERMNPTSTTKWLAQFSERHGLPHIHPHALRHTVASIMIENGIDVVTVAGQLGHADATTTERIYAHELERSRAKASECIAGAL